MKRTPTGQLLETPLSGIKEKMLSFLASFQAGKKKVEGTKNETDCSFNFKRDS